MGTEIVRVGGMAQPWSVGELKPKFALFHSWNDVRSGYANPKYQSQIAQSREAGTAYSALLETHDIKSALLSGTTYRYDPVKGTRVVYRKYSGLIQPPNPGFGSFSIPAVNSAKSTAAAKLATKVQEAKVLFEGPTFLGELGETVRMIRRPAAGLYPLILRYVADAKRLRRNAGKSIHPGSDAYRRALRELYLEYRFGWQPLLSDVVAGAEALARLHLVESPRLSARAEVEVDFPISDHPNSMGPFTFGRLIQWRKLVVSVRAYARLRSEILGARNDRVMDAAGFAPSNFLPTVWNLLPWSFVVDYMTNVNELISYACYNPNVNSVYSGMVIREELTSCSTATFRAPPASIAADWQGGVATWNASRLRLTRAVGVPTPALQLNLPSVKQAVNMVALLDTITQSRR